MKKRIIFCFLILLFLTGCSQGSGLPLKQEEPSGSGPVKGGDAAPTDQDGNTEKEQEESAPMVLKGKKAASSSDMQALTRACRDIYEGLETGGPMDSLTFVSELVRVIGEQGYAAVDGENRNQVDMVHPEQVEAFCRRAQAEQEADTVIFLVLENGDLLRFDLKAAEQGVRVTRSVWSFKGGELKQTYTEQWPAETFEYTEEGWLFFAKQAPEGYDGAPGYTALRVKPLPKECREYNRSCILPISYNSSNLFLTDWTEEDYADLDFQDLFGLLYPEVCGKPSPYEAGYTGMEYEVPREELEQVIFARFSIEKEELRRRIEYKEDRKCYKYVTRGFEDSFGSPTRPFPEVVACKENPDGTVKLTVHAVYPLESRACAFAHEVTVRPREDGGFVYVSNHVIPSEENVKLPYQAR